jgi:hypothetical protein
MTDDQDSAGPRPPPWTLDLALAFIRERQPNTMAAGYYIALAGGVLNAGSSKTDLDLVVVPMSAKSDPSTLFNVLIEDLACDALGAYHEPPAVIHNGVVFVGHDQEGRLIDIIVLDRLIALVG